MMTFSPFLLHALKSENWISLFSAGIPALQAAIFTGIKVSRFPSKRQERTHGAYPTGCVPEVC